jgi:hypothetical protein
VAALVLDALTKLATDPTHRYSALDRTFAVYARDFETFAQIQGHEDAAFRRRAASRRSSPQQQPAAATAGTGDFGAVPCIPPHCDFACSAGAMGPAELDEVARAAATVASSGADSTAIANLRWGDSFAWAGPGPAPPAKLVGLVAMAIRDGGTPSVLGGDSWPPPGRDCPALHRTTGQPLLPIRPLWIAVPGERVVSCVPRKKVPFANFVRARPGEAYAFGAADEHEYHRSYRHAYFGSTRKKVRACVLR